MDSENKILEFGFNWSSTVIIITIIVFAIIIGALILIWYPKSLHLILKIVITLFITIPILFCVSITPLKLTIDDENIKLKQIAHSIVIPLNDVENAVVLNPQVLTQSIRTFASGGFMGFIGKFKNEHLGNYVMYATESKNYILIKTQNKIYVFTPNNPKLAIDAINDKK